MDHDPSGARSFLSPEAANSEDTGRTVDPPPKHNSARFTAAFVLFPPAPHQIFWLALLVAGVAAFFYLAKRRRLLLAESDPLALRDTTDDSIALALDRKAPIHIQPLSGKNSFRPLSGILAAADEKTLLITLPEGSPRAQLTALAGQEAEFYLQTGSGRDISFLRFESIIIKVNTRTGTPLLSLARPLRLEPYQRRAWERYHPSPSQCCGLGLWHPWATEDSGNFGFRQAWNRSTHPLPAAPSELPPPALAYYPPKMEHAHIANISASGLGLRLSRPRAEELPSDCLLFMSLKNGSEHLHLWLACSLRHITALAGRDTALAGFEFMEWSRVPDPDSGIEWNKTNSGHGIEALKNWILRNQAGQGTSPGGYINLLPKE